MSDQPTSREPGAPEPTTGRIDGRVHLFPARVYYEDTDFSGVVYHARYLHFLERGRSDFLRLLGVHHADLLARPDPLVFAVRRMALEFERAARIDDVLLVRTVWRAVAGARLLIAQEIHRGEERLLSAEVEAVCLTPDGRPRRAPKDVAAKLAPMLPSELTRDGG